MTGEPHEKRRRDPQRCASVLGRPAPAPSFPGRRDPWASEHLGARTPGADTWAGAPPGVQKPGRQDPGRGDPRASDPWARPRPAGSGDIGLPCSQTRSNFPKSRQPARGLCRATAFAPPSPARRRGTPGNRCPQPRGRRGSRAEGPRLLSGRRPRAQSGREGGRERAGRGREGIAGALTGHVGEQRDAQQQLHPPAADGGREAQERLAQHPGPRAAAAGLLERLRRGRPEGPAPRPLPAGGARAHAPRPPRPAPQAQCGGPGGRRVRVRGPKRYSWAAVGGVLQTPIRALGADSGMGRCLEFFTASL